MPICAPPHITSHQNSLGVGLLQQSAPELVARLGVTEDELALAGGETVVDDHLDPLAEAPEVEFEHAHVGVLLVPLLLLGVREHLQGKVSLVI